MPRSPMQLEAVPEPFRELCVLMHHHGALQENIEVWMSLEAVDVGYTSPEQGAENMGWLCGLEFRIKELLEGL